MKLAAMMLGMTIAAISGSPSSAQTFDLRFDHSTVVVSDLEESAVFYGNILQLKELETPWGPQAPIRFFAVGSDQQLHVAQIDDGAIEPDKVFHLAFSIQEFDAYLSFLSEEGIEYADFSGDSSEPQVRPDGVRQIYIQDPDGNWIEINDAQSR